MMTLGLTGRLVRSTVTIGVGPVGDWTSRDSMRLITVIGVLIIAVVGGGMLLMYLRRKLSDQDRAMQTPGSVMEELRRMRREGVLSEAEYEASRRAAVARLAPLSQRGTGDEQAVEGRSSGRSLPVRGGGNVNRAGGSDRGRVAKPGFDLTGEPLPKAKDPEG